MCGHHMPSLKRHPVHSDKQDAQERILVLFSHKLYNHPGYDSRIQFISQQAQSEFERSERFSLQILRALSNELCQLDYPGRTLARIV